VSSVGCRRILAVQPSAGALRFSYSRGPAFGWRAAFSRALAVVGLGLAAAVTSGCAAPAEQSWQQPAAPMGPPAGAYPGYPGYGGYSSPPPAAWAPPEAAPTYQQGRASFYSDRLAGRATATGEPYDPGALTAAHRTLPFGAIVDVARADGRHVSVRINDRGPYAAGRIIDLSRRAAAELGIVRAGVADVVLRVIWVPPSTHRGAASPWRLDAGRTSPLAAASP
jgi:rare lipoprotein A